MAGNPDGNPWKTTKNLGTPQNSGALPEANGFLYQNPDRMHVFAPCLSINPPFHVREMEEQIMLGKQADTANPCRLLGCDVVTQAMVLQTLPFSFIQFPSSRNSYPIPFDPARLGHQDGCTNRQCKISHCLFVQPSGWPGRAVSKGIG